MGLRQFLTIDSPLEIMKNVFYFMLKAVFVLEIVTFLSWLFGYVEKRLDEKAMVNDTHREKLCFTQFSKKNGWLAASDLFHVFTLSIKFYTFHYDVLMFEKCDSSNIQGSKNEWLLLSASFAAKFGLVYVLILENAFS